MATQYIRFKGPCKWAQVFKPDPKFGNYKINLYLDDVELAKYKSSGIQVTPKEDEDGTYVTFRRPQQKLIKGQAVEMGHPRVEDKDRKEFTENIGNGSIVEVTIAVYDTMKGKGHTLHQVKVLEHVKYERAED